MAALETEKLKLAICEDEHSYRKLISEHLSRLGAYEVRATANLADLLRLMESWTPDVVLFDLYYHKTAAFEGPREIRSRAPGTKVIALTSSSYDGDIRRALDRDTPSTFDGYLTKDVDPSAIDGAIRQVLRGIRYIDPTVADDAIPNPLRDLTASEKRVLQGLADGLSQSEIAALLPRSSKTGRSITDRQVRRVADMAASKLGAKSTHEAISIALRRHLIT